MMALAGPLAWLMGPIGRYVAAGFAVLAIATFIYGKGYAAASRKCDAAALRSQIAVLIADIEAAKRAAADDAARAEHLSKVERATMERLNALQSELAARPASGACRLSPADARRLRGL